MRIYNINPSVEHKQLTQQLVRSYATTISENLGVTRNSVESLIFDATSNQVRFLKALADKYKAMYILASEKESPENVFSIYKSLRKPDKAHFGVVQYGNSSFEDLEKIFALAKDRRSLNFVKNADSNIFEGKKFSHKIILDILRSPNEEKYIEHTDDYLSYFRLYREDKDSVKALDELIKNGLYNKKLFDAKYAAKTLTQNPQINEAIGIENIEKHYSESGVQFINRFFGQYFLRNEYKVPKSEKLVSMYKTTTPENVEVRTWLMDRFRDVAEKGEKAAASEIDAMHSLFEKIDNDKDAKIFVENFLAKHVPIDSIKSLNEILENVPARKAKIFHKNIYRIINATEKGEERIKALQNEITNPFFETDLSRQKEAKRKLALKKGFGEKEPRFNKAKKYIENKFNIFRYNYLSDKGFEGKQLVGDLKNIIFKKTKSAEQAELKTIITSADKKAETKAARVEFIIPKESYKERKFRIISDINEIISKKLHSKTLEDQQGTYSKNATKIRLKLLPEIFESIKETRKADRIAGKTKFNSSNKDALLLYKRINGKNRKLVRYMLMKRNTDGTRMFEVNDIIAFLDKTENAIFTAKAKNPNFKIPEIKAYYESLFQSQIEQYGKLK